MEEVKIGFLGFGNVGTGAYKIIRDNGNDIFLSEGVRLKVAKILVRDINKKRNVEVDNSILTDKFEEIVNDPESPLLLNSWAVWSLQGLCCFLP